MKIRNNTDNSDMVNLFGMTKKINPINSRNNISQSNLFLTKNRAFVINRQQRNKNNFNNSSKTGSKTDQYIRKP